ncbi:hypothetical protein OG596_02695 [Streptomyces sp. NBC_01102]|uniref:hypothetical protein n=1 Tax=unclassified Streptomyces TaxID=2593676 RepID=UPI00386F7B71|nr:hypothetical protein OG596_02695 [Streptomyces sp. NBC_01102]
MLPLCSAAAAITAEIIAAARPALPADHAVAMHTAFTCLKPRQLITFSGLTFGTDLAFAQG